MVISSEAGRWDGGKNSPPSDKPLTLSPNGAAAQEVVGIIVLIHLDKAKYKTNSKHQTQAKALTV